MTHSTFTRALKLVLSLFVPLILLQQLSCTVAAYESRVVIGDEPPSSNCQAGGKKIESGFDRDADGVLGTDEVSSTSYACNRDDGSANAIVTVTTEPAGSNCSTGGHKILAGIDANTNGNLDADEVEAISFVCHSENLGQETGTETDTGSAATVFSVENEAVTCQTNESFKALEIILKGGKVSPTGRGEQSAVYDPCNKRIILFGGNDYQPEQCADFGPKRFKADTWSYVPEYQNWALVNTATNPPPRGRQAMAFDLSRKRAYLFGGRYRAEGATGDYTMYNDLWAFDVNTDTWTQIPHAGDIPSARGNTAMVYDDLNDRLVLFGGSTSASGLSFTPQNDTYILNLDNFVWTRVATGGTVPPKRLFHHMVVDGTNNQVLVYGGGNENAFFGDFLNDLWGLDLTTLMWTKIWEANQSGGSNTPDSRINGVLLEDRVRQQIFLFAGHDETSVGHRNDLWQLNPSQGTWTPILAGDTGTGSGCASFCSCEPDFVEVDMNSPERRQYHSLVPIEGEDRAVLFGGKGDCGYLDDTWSFGFATQSWTEIEPASQGEACKRTGRDNCTDLCY